MNRRTFVASVAACGTVSASGCLGSTVCDESSNNLYVENVGSEERTVEVRVRKESDGLFDGDEWTDVFTERVAVPAGTHRTVEGLYDEHGTYRTVAEFQFDDLHRSEQQRSAIDQCHDQTVAIGVGDAVISIVNGAPDRLSSGNGSTE